MIDIPLQKDKIAIVVVGYNRLRPLKRLLSSLERAEYPSADIPLVISIDCSGDEELYGYVRNFEWKFGPKYVNIQEERLGLLKHVMQCGSLSRFFKGVIVLEDDVFVSEHFYSYVSSAVDYYYDEDRIGGISLYRNEMEGPISIALPQDGKDVFLRQRVATWGECWTDRMWAGFEKWFADEAHHDLSAVDMPEYMKQWKNAWSKYYMAYEIATGKYFLYPSVSLTTCFSDAGVHSFDSTICQVTLLSGPKEFKFVPFGEMTIYDIYETDSRVYSWMGIPEKDLMVSFRDCRPNKDGKRYILSPYSYPYKVERSYALSLAPIELNVKFQLEGDELYLYDTLAPGKARRNPPLSIAYYFLKNFNVRLMARYVWDYSTKAVIRKIKKKLHAGKH